MRYEDTANELVHRIVDAVPPNTLRDMESAWDLFRVEGFHCDDLQPSLMQATWALATAKSRALSKAEGE